MKKYFILTRTDYTPDRLVADINDLMEAKWGFRPFQPTQDEAIKAPMDLYGDRLDNTLMEVYTIEVNGGAE